VNRVRVRLDAEAAELVVLTLDETLVDEDVRERDGGIVGGKREGGTHDGRICTPESVAEPKFKESLIKRRVHATRL
jgi:hypothetical protein